MPDGRFRHYYWQIRTLFSEKDHLLDMGHPAHAICEGYEVEYTDTFTATIVFKDGSRLVVRFTLRSDDDVEEYNYTYVYLDARGNRAFQYDDAPHHPELPTHPITSIKGEGLPTAPTGLCLWTLHEWSL